MSTQLLVVSVAIASIGILPIAIEQFRHFGSTKITLWFATVTIGVAIAIAQESGRLIR